MINVDLLVSFGTLLLISYFFYTNRREIKENINLQISSTAYLDDLIKILMKKEQELILLTQQIKEYRINLRTSEQKILDLQFSFKKNVEQIKLDFAKKLDQKKKQILHTEICLNIDNLFLDLENQLINHEIVQKTFKN